MGRSRSVSGARAALTPPLVRATSTSVSRRAIADGYDLSIRGVGGRGLPNVDAPAPAAASVPGKRKRTNAQRRQAQGRAKAAAGALPPLRPSLREPVRSPARASPAAKRRVAPRAATPDPARRKVRFESSDTERPASITPLALEWKVERALDQQERSPSGERADDGPKPGVKAKAAPKKGKGKGKQKKGKGKGRR